MFAVALFAVAGAAAAKAGGLPAGYEFLTDPGFLRLEAQYIERMHELVARTPNEHRSEVILRLLESRLGSQYRSNSGMEPDPEGCIRRFAPLKA